MWFTYSTIPTTNRYNRFFLEAKNITQTIQVFRPFQRASLHPGIQPKEKAVCKEVLDSIIHEGKNCQGTRTERRSGATESMYLHEVLQNHRVTAICIRQKKKGNIQNRSS